MSFGVLVARTVRRPRRSLRSRHPFEVLHTSEFNTQPLTRRRYEERGVKYTGGWVSFKRGRQGRRAACVGNHGRYEQRGASRRYLHLRMTRYERGFLLRPFGGSATVIRYNEDFTEALLLVHHAMTCFQMATDWQSLPFADRIHPLGRWPLPIVPLPGARQGLHSRQSRWLAAQERA